MMMRTLCLRSCKWSKASLLPKKRPLKILKKQAIRISSKPQLRNRNQNLLQNYKTKEYNSRTTLWLHQTLQRISYLGKVPSNSINNLSNSQRTLSSNNRSNRLSPRNTHLRSPRSNSQHLLKSWSSRVKLRIFLQKSISPTFKLKSLKLFVWSSRKRRYRLMNLWLSKMHLDFGLLS